jgi:hypothetical protein
MSDSSKNTANSDFSNELWKPEATICSLSKILSEIIEENLLDKNNADIFEKQKKMVFNSKKPPGISIKAYVERIIKYTHLEESTLVLSLIYIDRVCELQDLVLSWNNIHR